MKIYVKETGRGNERERKRKKALLVIKDIHILRMRISLQGCSVQWKYVTEWGGRGGECREVAVVKQPMPDGLMARWWCIHVDLLVVSTFWLCRRCRWVWTSWLSVEFVVEWRLCGWVSSLRWIVDFMVVSTLWLCWFYVWMSRWSFCRGLWE